MTRTFTLGLKTLLMLGAVVLTAVNTRAEEDNQTLVLLSLEQVKALALEKSPLVKQIDADFSKRVADSIEVTLLPNPEFSSEVRVPVAHSGARGDNEVDVSLAQPFRLSHFGLRREVSRLIEIAATSEQKAAILELTQSATLSYIKLWALQQKHSFLEEAKRRAERKAKAMKEAAVKGLLGAGDEKFFMAEERKIAAQLIGVDADIAVSVAELIRLTGCDIKNAKTLKPAIDTLQSVDDLLRKAHESTISIIGRANLLVHVADKQYQLADKDTFPALTPRLAYEHTDDEIDRIGVGISIPLPFSDRNQSERKSRLAELNAARAKATYANSKTFREEISSLRRSVDASLKQAVIYENEVVPAFRDALKAHEHQFEAGQGTILQVWQTQRELNNSQEQSLELWVKAFAARAQLSILIGEELS